MSKLLFLAPLCALTACGPALESTADATEVTASQSAGHIPVPLWMKELMHEMSLPAPEFSQHSAGGATVLVTLRNNFAGRRPWIDHDIETIIGQVVADALTEAERQCLNFMANNDDMSVTDGQKVTGRAWETVKKVLVSLEGRGIVERHARGDIKRDPKARYRIKRAQVAPVTDGSPED